MTCALAKSILCPMQSSFSFKPVHKRQLAQGCSIFLACQIAEFLASLEDISRTATSQRLPRGQSHLSNRCWAQRLRPVITLPALFIVRTLDSFDEKVEIHWTDECQISGKGTEWFQRWSVISGSDGNVLVASAAPASLCSNAPKEVPICWLEIHSRGRLMMQCKEACLFLCSLTDKPSQPSPLHGSICNYVISGNKVQSQFMKNLFPPLRGRKKWGGVI